MVITRPTTDFSILIPDPYLPQIRVGSFQRGAGISGHDVIIGTDFSWIPAGVTGSFIEYNYLECWLIPTSALWFQFPWKDWLLCIYPGWSGLGIYFCVVDGNIGGLINIAGDGKRSDDKDYKVFAIGDLVGHVFCFIRILNIGRLWYFPRMPFTWFGGWLYVFFAGTVSHGHKPQTGSLGLVKIPK